MKFNSKNSSKEYLDLTIAKKNKLKNFLVCSIFKNKKLEFISYGTNDDFNITYNL